MEEGKYYQHELSNVVNNPRQNFHVFSYHHLTKQQNLFTIETFANYGNFPLFHTK